MDNKDVFALLHNKSFWVAYILFLVTLLAVFSMYAFEIKLSLRVVARLTVG